MMGMAFHAAVPGVILPRLGGVPLESNGPERASTPGSSIGRIEPYLPRTAGLGETASIAEMIEGALVPGREGITLTDKTVRFGDLYRLSEKTGGIEFALTRETVDGEKVFRLYSGGRNAVTTPRAGPNVRIIGPRIRAVRLIPAGLTCVL
jgi:hypothetical protein